ESGAGAKGLTSVAEKNVVHGNVLVRVRNLRNRGECKSAVEWSVDQRKLMPTGYDADLAHAEQLAELAGGHRYRTRLPDAFLSGCGQRVGERHGGVQGDIALDLLQHLMDVPVEHGD